MYEGAMHEDVSSAHDVTALTVLKHIEAGWTTLATIPGCGSLPWVFAHGRSRTFCPLHPGIVDLFALPEWHLLYLLGGVLAG